MKRKIKSIPLNEFRIILEHLQVVGSTDAYDQDLLEKLDFIKLDNEGKIKYLRKKLEDRLKYIESEKYLISYKDGHRIKWKIKNEEYIAEELLENDILNLDGLIEYGMEYVSENTMETFKKIFKADPKLLGKFRMFEEIQSEKLHNKIEKLLEAIENRYYTDITLHHDSLKIKEYREIKPVKVVFSDDNWYLAFEYKDADGKPDFRLGRIAFIDEDIKFSHEPSSDEDIKLSHKSSPSRKKTFQTKDLKKYIDFLENNLQNAMTRYGVEKKTVKLKAQGDVTQYFQKGMKKFFPSQNFIEELEDGSVIFTVEYTRELEILPFIQKWMPDLVILEPEELKEAYTQKLQKTLENLS